MTPNEEIQRLLILDLATENPISVQTVETLMPASTNRRIYRVSDFGAEPAPQGTPERAGTGPWKAWTDAIDRMLAQVRADLGGHSPHYYLAGRAGLPAFAYLGMRLGKLAQVTVINKRYQGPWDVMPFQGQTTTASGTRFFDEIKGLERGSITHSSGKIAVFVSTQNEADPDKLRAFLRAQKCNIAGLVEILARPDHDPSGNARKWLDGSHAAQAAAEIEEIFTALKNQYHNHEGLVVFIAGPVPLAVMVGRAINPRIYTPVWIPNHRDGYVPAVESPWRVNEHGEIPRILVATANTPGTSQARLDLERELGHIQHELEATAGAGRFELAYCPAAQLDQLMDRMEDFRPHVLHFSGHGDVGGTFFRDGNGGDELVPAGKWPRMLALAREYLRLVVLSCCRSHQIAALLAQSVDCVIGIEDEIEDDVAIRFSRVFYRTLGREKSVAHAYERACLSVSESGAVDQDRIHLCPGRDRDPGQMYLFGAGG